MVGRIENQVLWILLSVGGASFIFTAWLAVVNKGGENSYQVLKPILGGIGVSLLLLATMLLSTPQSYTRVTSTLILAKRSGQIVPLENLTIAKHGFDIHSGYFQFVSQGTKYWENAHSQKDQSSRPSSESLQDDTPLDYLEFSQYLLELAEWSTMTWIAFTYPGHWQMEHEWFDAISPGGGAASVKSTADPRDIMRIDICELLQGNRFAEFYKNQEPRANPLLVPRGSLVKFRKLSETNHALLIETKQSWIKIDFETGIGGTIGITDLAEAVIEKFGPAWNQQIKVSFNVTPKRLRQWSKKSQIEQQWIRDLSQFYDDSFAWSHLKKRLEGSLGIQWYWQGFRLRREGGEKQGSH